MVRWVRALISALVLLMVAQSAFAKRFIVHYKSQSMTKSGGSSVGKVIVNAQSKEDVKQTFPLGHQNIVEIEEDILLKAFLEPGDRGVEDSYYQSQWHYYDVDGGIELPMAWDVTTGTDQVVVAVLDTGVLAHSDLRDKLLLGADLISDRQIANDGDGRDLNATDPGDWVEAGDQCYTGRIVPSSWHGTHVAGTIAAETANGTGVAGVSWGAKILPVRVLGKCGGWMSDIADGIRWAAGGQVRDLPVNQNPAHVINLSLGGRASCTTSMQSAIDFAHSKGAVVVVAAGNDQTNLNFTPYVPATCRNVITVGAGNRFALKSFYSNYGDHVDVMAPGGDYDGRVLSTSNTGRKGPDSDNYEGMMGTSMAAPHVAGVAALILGAFPRLYPAQIEDILKRTTKYFGCTANQGCGQGLVDAFSALEEAKVTTPDGSFQGTEPISSGPPITNTQPLTTYEEDGGGMCGSVAYVDGPKPPKGGMGAFLLSLGLGFAFTFLGQKKSWKSLRSLG